MLPNNSIDPYVALLKQLERKAFGYGFLAFVLMGMAIVASGVGSDGARQSSTPVEIVRSEVGLILLGGSGLCTLAATWFIGRYVYFFKWPARFE